MDNQINRASNNSTNPREDTITRTRRNTPTVYSESTPEYEEEYENETEDYSSEPQEVKYRIGVVAATLLMGAAIFFDVLELSLDLIGTSGFGIGVIVGYISDAMSFIFFPATFFVLGAPIWKGRKVKKKLIANVTAIFVGLIPWVGAIVPQTIISTGVTIYLSRSEDKIKVKKINNQKRAGITRSKRT